MENILSISHKLNFTPNTLGCYGLSRELLRERGVHEQTLLLSTLELYIQE